jgi:hypothetical protein
MASSSVDREHGLELRHHFTMLKPICQYAKRKRLGLRDRFFAGAAVGKDARQINNLSDPATVVFSFELYREVTHAFIVQRFFPTSEYSARASTTVCAL